MRKLTRLLNCRACSGRVFSTAGPAKYLLAENLQSRSILRFHGRDALPLLQGLVTNDVTQLRKDAQSVYGLFLTRGGKVLADTIIYRTIEDNTFLVECDRGILGDLKRHSRRLKGRDCEIDIDSLNGDFSVWAIFNDCSIDYFTDPLKFAAYKNGGSIGLKMQSSNSIVRTKKINEEILMCRDPRLRSLGTRMVVPQNFSMSDINKLFAGITLQSPTDDNDYTMLRYKLGVGEGIDDHMPEKILPMETNGDFLKGFCLWKNGYVGQDNTANTYHSKMIRKRLMPLIINRRINFTNLNVHMPNGKHIGKLISNSGRYGLALLRVDKALEAFNLLIDGIACEVKRPTWWPANAWLVKRKMTSAHQAPAVPNDMEEVLRN